MSADERTGWECRFCRETLKPQSLIGWRRLLWIVPVRTFRCPHCFNTFRKPAAFIASIPFAGRLFCEKRGVSASVAEMLSNSSLRGKKSRRNYVNAGWLVRFARWSGRVESNVVETLGRFFRTLLWPFHWFSKTFLGTSDKSQRSNRSKSRRRSRSSRSDDA
jgi:hypothetical protein